MHGSFVVGASAMESVGFVVTGTTAHGMCFRAGLSFFTARHVIVQALKIASEKRVPLLVSWCDPEKGEVAVEAIKTFGVATIETFSGGHAPDSEDWCMLRLEKKAQPKSLSLWTDLDFTLNKVPCAVYSLLASGVEAAPTVGTLDYSPEKSVHEHQCSTTAGSSGAPVVCSNADAALVVVGMHTGSKGEKNAWIRLPKPGSDKETGMAWRLLTEILPVVGESPVFGAPPTPAPATAVAAEKGEGFAVPGLTAKQKRDKSKKERRQEQQKKAAEKTVEKAALLAVEKINAGKKEAAASSELVDNKKLAAELAELKQLVKESANISSESKKVLAMLPNLSEYDADLAAKMLLKRNSEAARRVSGQGGVQPPLRN